MSSASKSPNEQTVFERAERIKRELAEFATAGLLKDEYERQHQLFFELSDPADEHESESVLDWFLFDWFDDDGRGVIDYFLSSRDDLAEQDSEMLMGWEDSVNSVFEITSLGKNSLALREMDSGDNFSVATITPLDRTPFKRGQFIAARLLPLGDKFIFSGLQFIMPNRDSAIEALEMRRTLESLNSPEALEKAQREQCSAFCEVFGCDELSIPSKELNSTLQRFQHYLFAERRDPDTGLTAAERFQAEFGRELKVPDLPPLPEPLAEAGEVTILCDDFDGIVLLPDFNKFKRIFESDNPDRKVAGWQELVWKYIKDPDIPIVAFERVAEEMPDRVERVMRRLLDDKDFSIEHLYAALLHYKQPVEGFDDLKADQQLWDLFNGNVEANGSEDGAKPKASAAKAGAKTASSKSRASASKKRPAPRRLKSSTKKAPAKRSSGKLSARKSSAAKSGASKLSASKLSARKLSARKSTASKAGAKARQPAKGRARKSAPAKKR
jgi:hypothetical protein